MPPAADTAQTSSGSKSSDAARVPGYPVLSDVIQAKGADQVIFLAALRR